VPDITTAPDSRSALEADLALETQQLEHYRERVQQANEVGLADVAEALRPLLTETQEHVRDLSTALGL
jgi:bacterioferritin